MKRFLPKSSGLQAGFTLVELLVTIAIIAILAAVGITIFSNVQLGARDARRRVDLEAIGNALEVNKIATGYQLLTDSQFASGSIPVDPVGGANGNVNHGGYCISRFNTGFAQAIPTLIQLYAAGNVCNPSGALGVGVWSQPWHSINSTEPVTGTTVWMICAAIGEPGATVVCKSSTQ